MKKNIVKGVDFKYGFVDDLFNYRAIVQGQQIITCQKKHAFPSYFIYLREKANFKSDFQESLNAAMYKDKEPNPYVVNYIAEISYEDIPYDKKAFWEQMYNNGEFKLWDIKDGPVKFFESKLKGRFFMFLRVYKLPFELQKGKDYNRSGMVETITNEATLEKMQDAYNNDKCEPVLLEVDYEKKYKKIRNVIDLHFSKRL